MLLVALIPQEGNADVVQKAGEFITTSKPVQIKVTDQRGAGVFGAWRMGR